MPGPSVADWGSPAGLNLPLASAADADPDYIEPEEVELPPTEVANARSGEVGGRPTLPFARAVDHPVKHPATYKRKGHVVDGEPVEAVQRYCKRCFVGLPTAAKGQCPNCGAPLKKT